MEELRAAMRDLQLKRWEGIVSHTHAHTRIHTHTHHTHNIHTVTYMHMRTHVHTRTHTPHHTHTHTHTHALKGMPLPLIHRKDVLFAMMERSNEEAALGKGPLERLLNIEQDIAGIRNRLGKLEAGNQGKHAETFKDNSSKNQAEAMSGSRQKAILADNKLSESNPLSSALTWLSPLSSELSSPSSEEQPPPLTRDPTPPHLEAVTSREPTPPITGTTTSWDRTLPTTEVTMPSSTNHLITPHTSPASSVSSTTLSASQISSSPMNFGTEVTVTIPFTTRLTPSVETPALCESLTAVDHSRVATNTLSSLPSAASTVGSPPTASTTLPTLQTTSVEQATSHPTLQVTLVEQATFHPTLQVTSVEQAVSHPTLQATSVEQAASQFPGTKLSPIATHTNVFMGGASVPGLGRGRRTRVSHPPHAHHPSMSSSLMSPVLATSSNCSGPPITGECSSSLAISSQAPGQSLTGLPHNV